MAEYFAGIDAMRERIAKLKEDEKKAARRGLYTAARNILNFSNRKVPFELGDLSRDGAVSMDDESLTAAISYGRDADTRKYAEIQHEDLSYHHDAGRSAKFLERAMSEQRETTVKILGEAVKESMG